MIPPPNSCPTFGDFQHASQMAQFFDVTYSMAFTVLSKHRFSRTHTIFVFTFSPLSSPKVLNAIAVNLNGLRIIRTYFYKLGRLANQKSK